MRSTIKKAAPKAKEVMSYGIPAFRFHGLLVWFAAYSRHIGFYPRKSAIQVFKKELSKYKGAKGSVRFPLDKPLPLTIIRKMVLYRVNENLNTIKLKKGK
ncbi:MAG: DUF1801 domain-containing protein [Chitinophagales bacterium]|nr:DUF1801 domain-containing protein [Chitinophagales bacterium]